MPDRPGNGVVRRILPTSVAQQFDAYVALAFPPPGVEPSEARHSDPVEAARCAYYEAVRAAAYVIEVQGVNPWDLMVEVDQYFLARGDGIEQSKSTPEA